MNSNEVVCGIFGFTIGCVVSDLMKSGNVPNTRENVIDLIRQIGSGSITVHQSPDMENLFPELSKDAVSSQQMQTLAEEMADQLESQP